jgi:hypothetical protein
MRLCSVEGCGVRHYGRGFCKQHYYKEIVNKRWGPLKSDSLKPCWQTETWKASLHALLQRTKKDA